MASQTFDQARVLTFAGRRSKDMGRLIETRGGRPVLAPAMREVPLQNDTDIDAALAAMQQNQNSWLILLSGGGAKLLLNSLEKKLGEKVLLEMLSKITIVARGPKPAHILKQWGKIKFLSVPEPNTWHEVLQVIDQCPQAIAESTVLVQEFGVSNEAFLSQLQECGAKVLSVPVYRWSFPENLEPVKDAIRQLVAGEIEVTLWTAAAQVHHVFAIATEMGCDAELADALKSTFIGSVGPTTSAALAEYDIKPNLEPTHPKMGHLIKEAAEGWRRRRSP